MHVSYCLTTIALFFKPRFVCFVCLFVSLFVCLSVCVCVRACVRACVLAGRGLSSALV